MSDTVTLHWPRASTFRDSYTGNEYRGEGTYEVPAAHEAHYRRRGWEDPPADHDGDGDDPDDAENPRLDGPTRDELEGADPSEVADDESGGDESDESTDEGGDSGN